MSKWYRGRVTLDEIDQPVTIGRTVFRVVGSLTIEVEACDESRDWEVVDCDLSIMFGDTEVACVRKWSGIGLPICDALKPRLDAACGDCECVERIERIEGFRPVSPAAETVKAGTPKGVWL